MLFSLHNTSELFITGTVRNCLCQWCTTLSNPLAFEVLSPRVFTHMHLIENMVIFRCVNRSLCSTGPLWASYSEVFRYLMKPLCKSTKYHLNIWLCSPPPSFVKNVTYCWRSSFVPGVGLFNCVILQDWNHIHALSMSHLNILIIYFIKSL